MSHQYYDGLFPTHGSDKYWEMPIPNAEESQVLDEMIKIVKQNNNLSNKIAQRSLSGKVVSEFEQILPETYMRDKE